MPFETSPLIERIREMVREFTEREVIPHRAKLRAQDEEFEKQLKQKQIAAGFHLNLVPREMGGTGLGQMGRAVINEEMDAAWPGARFYMQNEWAYFIFKYMGGEMEKKWMPGVIKGEIGAGPSITEPSGGSDVMAISTNARKDGDSWVINGRKCFMGHAHTADWTMVLTKTGDPNDPATRGTRAFTAFMVPKGTPGFHITRTDDLMGRKHWIGDLVFDNVRVPESHIVGKVGEGMRPIFMAVGDMGRLGACASLTGIVLGCYECSTKYALQRHLYGKPLADLQAIQFRIAEMCVDLEACRALVYRAAWLRDRGVRCNAEQAIAKYFCSQAAARCSLSAMQLHGAYGLLDEYMPSIYYRFAPNVSMAGGSDEALKRIIATAALEGANPDLSTMAAEELKY